MTFTERRILKEKPNAETLPFGKYFTDYMFIMPYDTGKGWHSPRICPNEPLVIDPSAMVLHYGQTVFEGLKAYRTASGINLFRPKDNFARLNRSCARMCIPTLDEAFCLLSLKELLNIEQDWVPSQPGTSLYIRPFIIATESAVSVHVSNNYLFMIILSPCSSYYKGGLAPVNILIENEYVRAVRGGSGQVKAGANYAISLKGQEKANNLGFEQVLWLDGVERKYVEEVGSMNVFFKINGTVVTPELTSGSILPGITRDTVLRLLKQMGIPTEERRISADEVTSAAESGALTEAFGSGTAAVISPIGSFLANDKKIVVNNGGIGDVSAALYKTITDIQYGRVKDTFGWTEGIE